MAANKNAIILCSGGLDSVVTANYIKGKLKYCKIIILFFNYGQKSLVNERFYSKKCAKKLKAKFMELNLPELKKLSPSLINVSGNVRKLSLKDLKDTKKESDNWYVPSRNTIFLVYALAIAESLFIKSKCREKYDIFVGFKNDGKESFPDATKEFVNEMNKLERVSVKKGIKIIAPLIGMDKEDIVNLGVKLNVNFKDTFSCYISNKLGKQCGYCLACRLRQEGFYWAGIKDPSEYTIKMKDFRAR
ncbi:MAG: 7-cyano-7-deazaguanine synthase [Nanoarchaeota archaeon]